MPVISIPLALWRATASAMRAAGAIAFTAGARHGSPSAGRAWGWGTFKNRSPINVGFGSKADICSASTHVRFTPNSDRESDIPQKAMSALPLKVNIVSTIGRPRREPHCQHRWTHHLRKENPIHIVLALPAGLEPVLPPSIRVERTKAGVSADSGNHSGVPKFAIDNNQG